jgi:hypothetical protein
VIIDADDLFFYLLAGLTAFADNEFRYPYPQTLVYARGILAGSTIQSGHPNIQSISAFLQMVKHPIGEWWPLTKIPLAIDPELPLLYSDGQLPDFAMDWLLDTDQRRRLNNVSDIAAVVANRYIAEICDRLPGNPSLQADYIDFRRFLIKNPWIDAGTGLNIPLNVRQLMMDDVLRYYERVVSPNMIRQGRCWQCPRCKGILHWVDDQPHCVSGLCDRLTDLERAEPIIGQDILSLRIVFRRRVQLPGIPELVLFEKFSGMAGVQVDLWPEGDLFDLRVKTANKLWQLDVKDYTDPRELAVHLRSQSHFRAGTQITYIIPAYRDDLTPGYSRTLRQLVPGTSIFTDEELIERVQKNVEVGQ